MSNSSDSIEQLFSSLLSGAESADGKFVYVSFNEDGQPMVKSLNGKTSTMVETLLAWNQEEGRNIYWSAGLRRLDLPEGQRGGEADITKMLAIVVDIDDADAARDAGQKAQAMGIIPTFVIRTSKTPTERKQLVYVWSEPTDDLDAWRVAARKLEYYFGGDFCSKDAAHVWRVPGSMNWPNAKKREAGRVPEISELVYESGRTYELDDFDILGEVPKETLPLLEVKPLDVAGASRKWGRMEEMLGFLPEWLVRDMFMPQQDRSEFDFKLAKEFIKAGEGLNSADYLLLYHLAHPTDDFTGKWREKEAAKAGAGDAYLARTWARATTSVENEAEEEKAEPASPFLSISQILELPPAKWLVKKLLGCSTLSVLFGPPGTGKSFLALELGICIASGEDFLGYAVSNRGPVLYVSYEGQAGLSARIKARKTELGIDDESPFFMSLSGPVLVEDSDVLVFINAIEREIERLGQMPSLIIFDTLNQASGGMDENSSDAMGKLIIGAKEVIKRTGASVLLVHHTGKEVSRGARGHSSLKAAVDTEIELSGSGVISMEVKKQKDGEAGKTTCFQLRQVDIGTDTDGDPVTSCIVELVDQGKAKRTKQDECISLLRESPELSDIEIVGMIGCNKSTVSRARKRFVACNNASFSSN